MKHVKLPSRIWLPAAALCIATAVQAQSSLPDPCNLQARLTQSIRERFTLPDGQLIPIPVTNATAQKPTVQTSRITAFAVWEFDGTQYRGTSTDSARIFWSGTRGRNFDYARFQLFSILNTVEANPLKTNQELLLPMYRFLTMDSLHNYTWNSGTSAFSDWTARGVNTLNSSGMLSGTVSHRLVAGTWEPQTRAALTWDANNNLTSFTNQQWDGTLWENANKTSYTYDGANMTEHLVQNWNTGSTAWVNDTRSVFVYTGNDMTSLSDQIWDALGSAWRNQRRQVFGYDNGLWVSTVFQVWNSITSVWNNDRRVVYTRDQGRITQEVTQNWNPLTSVWVNDRRKVYEYDGNGRINLLASYSWDGTLWQQEHRFSYGYTTAGNESVTTVTDESWSSGSSSWTNEKRMMIKYNEHDRITQMMFQTWNAGGFWDVASGDDKYNFHYETFEDGTTSIADRVQAVDFRYYPNPSSAYLTVESGNSAIAQVRLTDLTGRTMQEVTPSGYNNTVRIPTAQLSPGMYFLQVQHGGRTETASVLIQH